MHVAYNMQGQFAHPFDRPKHSEEHKKADWRPQVTCRLWIYRPYNGLKCRCWQGQYRNPILPIVWFAALQSAFTHITVSTDWSYYQKRETVTNQHEQTCQWTPLGLLACHWQTHTSSHLRAQGTEGSGQPSPPRWHCVLPPAVGHRP